MYTTLTLTAKTLREITHILVDPSHVDGHHASLLRLLLLGSLLHLLGNLLRPLSLLGYVLNAEKKNYVRQTRVEIGGRELMMVLLLILDPIVPSRVD